MFYEEFLKIDTEQIKAAVNSDDKTRVESAVKKESASYQDFLAMLSPAAASLLDYMAIRAREMTQKHFGKNINMYIPLYISNECSNECAYCGFNRKNKINRKTLSEEEVKAELEGIKNLGYNSILLLTGEAPDKAGLDYIARCVAFARKYFTQVSLEIYPMDVDGYKKLVDNGATGLTVYQETYDPETYKKVHLSGQKKNFEWRINTPDRAAQAGFRKIGIGALLGLYDWRTEAAYVGAHAAYIMKKYWKTEVSVSFPRMRGSSSAFKPYQIISDRELVQMIFALRIYTKFAGITLSTREAADFRDNMISLGVTNMSAGSKTNPGGYVGSESEGQFEICDDRSVEEILLAIKSKGYYPVFKDWADTFGGNK
ncbi:MAG: 2-iminoacetate synthase ThiH [Candidatus Goldiibacteriota bacterium HGW-Goldbacteria-1]|jgi:2-iminoacetate synthase|nr:MAG: 2-iminoacetate synthase ThiH [Candidatus Goldiibacteriota bacterium HGW-Goldbacteria-1]